MAKRRADDTMVRDSPSKRCCRSLHSVDVQLQRRLLSHVSVDPPSLLALLGSRCRKRPHYFEDPAKDETTAGDVHYNLAPCDTVKRVADVSTVRTSGSFEEHRTSATFTSHKKRHREDGVCPDTETAGEQGSSDADTNTEDCAYNSFQYWRVPLPELDLSLLQDAPNPSRAKDKDVSSEAMET